MLRTLPDPFEKSALRHGIAIKELRRQWQRLQFGSRYCTPEDPCRRGSGIQSFDTHDLDVFSVRGARLSAAEAIRFVPASGAASRMFKALVSRNPDAVNQLDARWSEFPFRDAAEETGPCASAEERLDAVIRRLDLPNMPKGALPFHLYPDGARTAFEEHMREWKATFLDAHWPVVHFTLPEKGRAKWEELLSVLADRCCVSVTTSIQHPATDTMAVDEAGAPFMKENGEPLFRPGGHGSLLLNLQELGEKHPGALVSIKNIDNVRPTSAHETVVPWRQALLGLAEDLDEHRKAALVALQKGDASLAKSWLARGFRHPTDSKLTDIDALIHALDRPTLVAGMVHNEGEPGGGPFWLRDKEGVLRAQIVESAEMDLADRRIGNCIAGATHFNPVDLVCALHDAKDQPYDLKAFVDDRRDFLVSKTHAGNPLLGLEHPGLWNGAMGCWNTYFVEVPSETFAPVKTVFDMLRPAHRV